MKVEQWRPVDGYEGFYEVSNMGRVRSLPRRCVCGKGTKLMKGCILSQSVTGKTAKRGAGYLAVRVSVDGSGHLLKVHRVVALAFIPNPLKLPQINHEDTDTFNNRSTNLSWTNNTGNLRHASRHGLLRPQFGEACATHKLTEQQVLEIRRLYRIGFGTCKILAAKFSISKSQIKRILRRQSWHHI